MSQKQLLRLAYILTMLLIVVSSCKKQAGTLRFLPPADSGTITMSAGDVTLIAVEGGQEGVEWTSSNTAVATVSNGYIFAGGPGSATITASRGKASASVNVIVYAKEVTFAYLPNQYKIQYGKTVTVPVTGIKPEDATVFDIIWSVSPAGIIDITPVEDGLSMYARAEGTADVTARAASSNVIGSFPVTVTGLTSLTLDRTSLSMKSGESTHLVATQNPSNMYTISWSSSDSNIAKVSTDGEVTAGNKSGKATITASAGSLKATCEVSVFGDDYEAAIFTRTAYNWGTYYSKDYDGYSEIIELKNNGVYKIPAGNYAFSSESSFSWYYMLAGTKGFGKLEDASLFNKWNATDSKWSGITSLELSARQYDMTDGFSEKVSLELKNGTKASVTIVDGFDKIRLDYVENPYSSPSRNTVTGTLTEGDPNKTWTDIRLSNVATSKTLRLNLRGEPAFGWCAAKYVTSSNTSVISVSKNGDYRGAVLSVVGKGTTTLTIMNSEKESKATITIKVI